MNSHTANGRDQPWAPSMAHRGWAGHLFAGWLCWMISIMEGAMFLLTRIDPYCGWGFAFPVQNTAPKKLPADLGISSSLSRYCTQSDSEQLQNHNSATVYADGMWLSYHVFHHLHQLNSQNHEMAFTSLKISYSASWSGVMSSTLQGMSESTAYSWCCFSPSRPQRSGNHEMECERLLPLLLLIIHQQNFTSCFHNSGLCLDLCLEVFVFKEEMLSPGGTYCFH